MRGSGFFAELPEGFRLVEGEVDCKLAAIYTRLGFGTMKYCEVPGHDSKTRIMVRHPAGTEN